MSVPSSPRSVRKKSRVESITALGLIVVALQQWDDHIDDR